MSDLLALIANQNDKLGFDKRQLLDRLVVRRCEKASFQRRTGVLLSSKRNEFVEEQILPLNGRKTRSPHCTLQISSMVLFLYKSNLMKSSC
mmetsp:Transcript_13448/g.20146  ORF Transcript_13448/g.20146 Transcript_13448/m.20146 type:complete len:91 (-) Transcript_13448:315-587(-)